MNKNNEKTHKHVENQQLTKVEQWLKYNTYNCLDYDNLFDLYCSKNKRTISLVMPALNEESTVGHIIETIFSNLNKDFQLLDEFILIDGGSTDKTITIVEGLAKKNTLLKLVHEKDILSYVKSKKGKGNQLWKGLYCSKGDIVLYCDSDLKNFDVRMIYGMIGPLLKQNIKFVKGFYERPLVINANVKKSNEGGRVTELCARPMLNLFYPELAGFIQPLGGEYGGYRDVLENVHYMTGYGVEVNILIELYEKYGLNIINKPINFYSFCVDPLKKNPSGSINFSVIDNTNITINLKDKYNEISDFLYNLLDHIIQNNSKIIIMTKNYNILKIENNKYMVKYS